MHYNISHLVSGVFIGLLQVVIVMTVSDTLGGSSSYQTIVSQWVLGQKLTEMFPYLAKFRCGIGNWWQVSGMLYRGGILFPTAQSGSCRAKNS